ESFQQEMAMENMNINNMLMDTVTNFLKRFNKTIGYDYVLGYNKAGNIFLANDTFDITNAVLVELNREYRVKNPKAAK
ncbi:MAG: molecular chaperone Skp, partial [Bacteroidetes bacterium HGW-Bacteroidetes-22]